MTYMDWCHKLMKFNYSKKMLHELKSDLSYTLSYFTIKDIGYFALLTLLWLSNIVLFPFYALVLTLYWKSRYKKVVEVGEDPLYDMVVYSLELPHLNGIKITKILSEGHANGVIQYRAILANKQIIHLNESQVLSKNILLNKKLKLEHELDDINYKLEYFNNHPEKKDVS